jgi:hypothetical protein
MRSLRLAFLSLFLILSIALSQAQTPESAKPAATDRHEKAMPKCTEPIAGLDVPDGPHGLYVPMFPGSKKNVEAEKYLLHNPIVCGANIYVIWAESDKGEGSSRYDFSYVDEQMAPWIAEKKPVNLIVWATSYSQNQSATPAYILSKTPTVECPKFGRVPIFWEKTFIENYKAFMAAVVQKYGSNRSIGYIRFGLGAGGETFPACMYELRRHGMSNDIWRDYLLGMLDYEKSLNSPKLLMVGINAYGNPPDFSLPNAVAKRAAQYGIAVGSQGLQLSDVQADASGQPCTVDWCHVFRDIHGKVPLELQTVAPSRPDGSGPGSLVELIPLALRNHTQILEILLPDWLVTYDPDFPGYEQNHVEYEKALVAAANVLGGH